MERRKFVIGLGSLAAGGAAAAGTGAFTATQTDRDVDIAVVDDSDALIALKPGLDSDIVSTDAMGGDGSRDGPNYLEIDFDLDNGGDGINPDSDYQLGIPPETGSYIFDGRWVTEDGEYEEEHAFRIENQDSESKDITVEFAPDESSHSNHAFGLVLIHDESVINYGDNFAFTWTEGSISHTAENVGPGELVYVVFTLQSGTYMNDVDMGGEITVDARSS